MITKRGSMSTALSRARASRRRRWRAARKFRPAEIKLLLVAKAPPPAPKPGKPERYFYYPDVGEHDSLFVEVAEALLGSRPSRSSKREVLGQLRDAGVFLIDMRLDPDDGGALDRHIPSLITRCRRLKAQDIILISTSVYDAAFRRLAEVGLPAVDARVDFPGNGRQRDFRRKFPPALQSIGWDR